MGVFLETTTTRGQIRVETGAGLVTEVKHDGKRNAQVIMRATHQQLREPVSAWADTENAAVWSVVQEAHAGRYEIEYRIEVHRKDGVALDKEIAQLSNREKVRDLVAVTRRGVQAAPAGVAPPEPASEGDDRPGWLTQAGQEATAQREGHRAGADPPVKDSPVRCELCQVGCASNADLIEHARGELHQANLARRGSPPDTTADAGDGATPPAAAGASRRPRVQEGRPWELYNSDHSLNLGSYSYQAVVGFVELAHELVVEHVKEACENGDEDTVSMRKVEGLARMLLDAADRVQALTRADGHVDRMDSSHVRSRGAVRTALTVYPVPWAADADTRNQWLDDLVAHAAGITRISLDLFRLHETGEGPR